MNVCHPRATMVSVRQREDNPQTLGGQFAWLFMGVCSESAERLIGSRNFSECATGDTTTSVKAEGKSQYSRLFYGHIWYHGTCIPELMHTN